MDPDGADRRLICKVCLRQYARYTCPRCNLAYCSLPCYKQHGEQCTESFYRDQALGELQGRTADDEQRHKVLDILARQQQQQLEDEEIQAQLLAALGDMKLQGAAGQLGGPGEELEEEGEEDEGEDGEEGEEDGLGGAGAAMLSALGGVLSEATLERLLHKAASRPSDEWEVEEADLTPEEWRAFQRAVALGKLGDTTSEGSCGAGAGGGGGTPSAAAASGSFTPWWELQEARELTLGPTGQRLVAELRDAAPAAAVPAELLPAAPEAPLPPLTSLTKAAPSPLLAWHLLEVLFAYCYTVRRFRGSWEGLEGSAAAVMLALTDVLAGAVGAGGGSGQGGEESGAARLPESAAQACLHVLERACGPPVGTSQDRAYAVAVLYDTTALLQNGRANVVLALADAHRLVRSALAPPVAPAGAPHPSSGEGAGAGAGPSTSNDTSPATARTGTGPSLRVQADTANAGGGGRAREAAAGDAGRVKTRAGAGGPPGARDGLSKAQRAQLGAAERKLFFLTVWANGLGAEEVEQVGAAVVGEWGVQHDAVVAGRGGRGRVVTR